MPLADQISALASRIAAEFKARGSLSSRSRVWTDCLNPVAAFDGGLSFVVSGTGAAWSSVAPGTDNTFGIARLALGTVATNRGSIAGPELAALPTATNAYTVRSGLIDSITAESTDGAFFRYTHSVNAGKWQAVCRSNGVETAVDTGIVAAANAWDLLAIQVNASGTQAVFKIDGVTVATITTNIPAAAGRETGYGLMVLRSLGTTALNAIDVDFVEAEIVFTAAR
jgi:hypothetical protein